MYSAGQLRLYANLRRHVAVVGTPGLGTTIGVQSWSQAPFTSLPLPTVALLGLGLATPPVTLPPFGQLRLDAASMLLLSMLLTTNGAAMTNLAIPNLPSLAGLPIYLQSVVEGRDVHGSPELRFTNALRLTLHP